MVNHHKGQVSLPGGMVENGESRETAALRETNEEIGVSADQIQLIGSRTAAERSVASLHCAGRITPK